MHNETSPFICHFEAISIKSTYFLLSTMTVSIFFCVYAAFGFYSFSAFSIHIRFSPIICTHFGSWYLCAIITCTMNIQRSIWQRHNFCWLFSLINCSRLEYYTRYTHLLRLDALVFVCMCACGTHCLQNKTRCQPKTKRVPSIEISNKANELLTFFFLLHLCEKRLCEDVVIDLFCYVNNSLQCV